MRCKSRGKSRGKARQVAGPYRALSAKAIIPIIAGRLIGWRGDG